MPPPSLLPEPSPPSNSPAVLVAGAFVPGVALGFALPVAPGLYTLLSALAAVLGLLVLIRHRIGGLLLLAAFLLAGVALLQTDRHHFADHEIGLFTTERPRLARVEAVLLDAPRLARPAGSNVGILPSWYVVDARVEQVLTTDGWVPAEGRISVRIGEPHPLLSAGTRLRMLGMLTRPEAARNPGQFDWAEHHRRDRVLATLAVGDADHVQVLADPEPGWLAAPRLQVRRWLAAGFDDENAVELATLRMLMLGDSAGEAQEVRDAFRRGGTAHHLAISGMHVAVLGGLVLVVCRLLRMSMPAAWVASVLFVLAYGLMTHLGPAVVRAMVLWTVAGVGLLSGRWPRALQLLAVAAVVSLAINPQDIAGAGFQLSYGVVLALIVLSPRLHRLLTGETAPDAPARPPTTWERLARRGDSKLGALAAASVTAWLASLPLVALHFSQGHPWAAVFSILQAPVVLAALVTGLLKVVCTAVLPATAPWQADVAAGVTRFMNDVAVWLGSAPFAEVPLPPPAVWLVGAYYLLLTAAWPASWLRLPTAKALAGLGVAGCVAAMFLWPLAGPAASASAGHKASVDTETRNGRLTLTMLSVGAGQCVVVQTPGGKRVMFDAGSLYQNQLYRNVIAPWARVGGIVALDMLVLSHANFDHFSAAADVARGMRVREVYLGVGFETHASGNAPARQVLAELAALELPPRSLRAGDRLPLDTRTTLHVLWPPDPSKESRDEAAPGLSGNDASLVLILESPGGRVLFTGDIQQDAMAALLEAGHDLRADVLIAPHHGSAESATGDFLAAVRPKVVLVSDDRQLSAKQKRFDRLVAEVLPGTRLYRTHAYGALHLSLEPGQEPSIQAFQSGR
ncbi:MAG: ComEC/Rec2 family competence protein [Phycisphaerae bacterium]